jgi:hypothetical protein
MSSTQPDFHGLAATSFATDGMARRQSRRAMRPACAILIHPA